MKPKLLLCLFVLLSFSCYANTPPLKKDTSYTIAQARRMAKKRITITRETIKGYRPGFDNCIFTNQYTVANRLKKYPYSAAIKIMLVSYYGGGQPNQDIKIDSPFTAPIPTTHKQDKHYLGLVIKNKKLDYSTLIETKVLNRKQVEELTNIVFNYDFAGMKNYTVTGFAACFDPRNSILFFDKNGKIFDHLDICFHCNNYESTSKNLSIGANCAQKFDMLARFFIKAGVRYGADNKVPLD
ncbi:hypothetical protein [Mucilaginibacter sp. OK283]|uniref:hypothetical protein n=1 Tax=Mucilaginibacter sp. OK283 TaxID=1881049 RepID=UPI0008CEBBEA|nr:hypothetical protein [Mucilaginibacter sp. OK283]SEO91969.1 hypothetical protein SAMN05428947_10561 [Mucilaginibacter sp. OK283]